MTTILLGLGLLLTRTSLDGPVGARDAGISRWFFQERTPMLDEFTEWGSRFGDTPTVIAIAAIVVVLLAIGHHVAQLAFLICALVIEITTFLTTTFLIDRERPAVPQLDDAPATSSFPSGHVAASLILYLGIALITTSLVRSNVVRAFVWTVAILLPIAVALSRLYRGMHHTTDIVGSIILAAGCIAVSLLATRIGVAIADRNKDTDVRQVEPSRTEAPDLQVTP